jgi:hypothetical protein
MGVKSQKGRASRVGLAGIMLLALNSCAGMSRADNERFQVAVTKNVSPGMSFVTGNEHLVKAGFSRDDRTSLRQLVVAARATVFCRSRVFSESSW